jgi:CheY-like chemotaxis protein
MNLSSLLVCADEAAAQVLRQVLEELSIRVESCPDLVRAAIRLAQQRFDVVILDCKSHPDAVGLLRETRHSRLNDSTLAVTVVQRQESIREMFSLGVNFVLYKPVAYDRALSSLRAARAVMRKEKRRRARAPVHAHAKVDYANVEQEKATLVDLAADGMAVLFGKKLPPTSKVYFQFQLPGQKSSVRLSGQVVWQDWNGLAGIQFADVPKASRRLLDEFLSATLPGATEDDFSAVTVELEQSFPSAPVSPASEARREYQPERVAAGHVAQPFRSEPPRSESSRSESGDRREKARYACRLGAEVYRTGTAVPNHCSLTDLSPGGCYLEMPLPFPKGTSIEITVRTYDLKLQLRGAVQASHPGYGMGVAFELQTDYERDQLQKLTDFVAATGETSE